MEFPLVPICPFCGADPFEPCAVMRTFPAPVNGKAIFVFCAACRKVVGQSVAVQAPLIQTPKIGDPS